jgi:four helix bundle protein
MLDLSHRKLDVWKMSLELTKNIYSITEKYPKSELFGLVSQLRRASVSVLSNISEGAARRSKLERRRFYEISRSSLVEVDTQLEISLGLKYIEPNSLPEISEKLNHLFAKLTGLINAT